MEIANKEEHNRLITSLLAGSIMLLLMFSIIAFRLKKQQQKITLSTQNLERLRTYAENATSAKSIFLSNMSHEIRTPLNAIVGFSRLMTTTDNREDEKLYSEIINQNSDVLLQLINDILDLSKIEAGTFEYIKQPMDLGEMCRNVYEIHKGRVQEGVTLTLDNENDSLMINEDKNRILQLITNLITNAIKINYEGDNHIRLMLKKH